MEVACWTDPANTLVATPFEATIKGFDEEVVLAVDEQDLAAALICGGFGIS